jgi:hypothetical protein
MAACSDHKETLVLDVHGELTLEESIVWEKHLAGCEDCRQERESLCALMQSAKGGLSVTPLSSQEEQFLFSRVQRTLRTHKPDARSKRLGWWLAPACAACMVLLFAGWFGLKDFRSPDKVTVTTKRVPEELAIRTPKELPENSSFDMVAITSERVPDVQVVSNTKEPLENSGHTAATATERVPEEVMRINEELLENMELLQDMESLEQLVRLLDKPEQETTQLERGNNADRFRAYA